MEQHEIHHPELSRLHVQAVPHIRMNLISTIDTSFQEKMY